MSPKPEPRSCLVSAPSFLPLPSQAHPSHPQGRWQLSPMGRSIHLSPRKRPRRPQRCLTPGPVKQKQLQCGLGPSQSTSSPTLPLPHPPVPSLAGGLSDGAEMEGRGGWQRWVGQSSRGHPGIMTLSVVRTGQRPTRVEYSLSQSLAETPRGPAAVLRPPCGWELRMAGKCGPGGRGWGGPPEEAPCPPQPPPVGCMCTQLWPTGRSVCTPSS